MRSLEIHDKTRHPWRSMRVNQPPFGAASGMGSVTRFPSRTKAAPLVSFERKELTAILGTYGTGVARGLWRDYAIDHLCDAAVFSIFRRSCETPLFRVEKRPKLARRQGAYAVIAATGLIMKRGSDLNHVLRALDKRLLKLVD